MPEVFKSHQSAQLSYILIAELNKKDCRLTGLIWVPELVPRYRDGKFQPALVLKTFFDSVTMFQPTAFASL
jgi:hypothetical protein